MNSVLQTCFFWIFCVSRWHVDATEQCLRAGKMAQWGRALTALLEILSSNSSKHMVAHNSPEWDLMPSLGLSEDSYSVLSSHKYRNLKKINKPCVLVKFFTLCASSSLLSTFNYDYFSIPPLKLFWYCIFSHYLFSKISFILLIINFLLLVVFSPIKVSYWVVFLNLKNSYHFIICIALSFTALRIN